MYHVRDSQLEKLLSNAFGAFKTPGNKEYVSVFKNIPIDKLNGYYSLTNGSQRYYIKYRGPRAKDARDTKKSDARSFDVYKRTDKEVAELRLEKIRYLEDRNEFLVYFECDDILRLKDEIRELKSALKAIKELTNV